MGSRFEANSNAVRKRIEQHTFADEDGEEYEGSEFGGFGDYFRRKKIKLQNLDAERRRLNADKPQIFRGIVVHVNGYTQPSLNDLHNMIVDHGGGFLQYLDGKTMVTHIVASNLTPKKKVEFRRYRIVKPAWIVDSIKAGTLLPWSNYRVVDEGVKQNLLGFHNGTLKSQPNTQQYGYREQTDTSWYTTHLQGLANEIDGKPSDIKPHSQLMSSKLETKQVIDDGVAKHAESTQSDNATRIGYIDEKDLDIAAAMSSYDQGQDDEMTTSPEDEETTGNVMNEQTLVNGPAERECRGYPASSENQMAPPKSKSAEEHNAALLADPKVWKSTVVNPGFLKQYYEESRLHHLSAWKAELKSQLQALAREQSSSQKAKQKRPAGARRYIFHCDFDSFFAAVSLKKHPELIDKPVVVAHGSGAGSEIASCNYPARKFGIKNGMWMKGAQELCPELKVLPYDFKAYEDASKEFYSAIMSTGGIVQSVSIDEALIDMSMICLQHSGYNGRSVSDSNILQEQEIADELAQQLRNTVKEKTGCAVSIGIGGNILLAKLALRRAKPAGQHQVKPDDILDFVGDFTVRDLPGVAHSIGKKLEELGVKYIKDIRSLTKERLMTTLGPKTGERIWECSRGFDATEVGEQIPRKSVSAEINWGIRFATQEQAEEFVSSLCEELEKRLVNERVKGRQFTMKIMKRAADAPMEPPKHLGHGKCDVFNKSSALGVATNDKQILAREAISILKSYGFSPGELRGIGVQVTKLEPMKSSHETEGSQRRLHFKKPESEIEPKPSLTRVPVLDGEDLLDSPQKPEKFVKHPAAALSEPFDARETKPLNTLGTQFILPSQVDLTVLAELPEDIRSRLGSKMVTAKRDSKQPSLNFKPIATSTSQTGPEHTLPSRSQLDPEALAALPEDIRAEVLASYQHPSPEPRPALTSPSKPDVKPPPKKTVTPTKKRSTLLSRMRGPKADNKSTLTQANFIAQPKAKLDPSAEGEIDEDFLAALPSDIRDEVLAQQRQLRLQTRGRLSVPIKSKQNLQPARPAPQRQLRLPPRPPKPTFTVKKLSSLSDLRDAVAKWVEAMEGEQPDEDDAAVLLTYLVKVVEVEKNMSKAVSVVKWLAWIVGEMNETERGLWGDTLGALKDGVQEAIQRRGLGAVEF